MKPFTILTLLGLPAAIVATPIAEPNAEGAINLESRQMCPPSLVASCKDYCYQKWCAGCGSYQPCLNSCRANRTKCNNCCGTKCTTC